MIRVLAALLTALGILLVPALQAAATTDTHPTWMVEQSQLPGLGPYASAVSKAGLVELSEGGAVTGAEHYSSIAPCTERGTYQMPCNSLTTNPPAAGSVAAYDPEKWKITPASEYANVCASWRTAAGLIRAAGAIPAASLPLTTSWQARCSARYAGDGGWVLLGQQNLEAHPRAYLAALNRLWQATKGQAQHLHYVFGLSTRLAYHASPWRIYQAWRLVHAAHPAWTCWLNVIYFDGSQWKASRVLSYIYGGGA